MSRNLGDGKEPVVGRYGEEFSVLNGKHKCLTVGIDRLASWRNRQGTGVIVAC